MFGLASRRAPGHNATEFFVVRRIEENMERVVSVAQEPGRATAHNDAFALSRNLRNHLLEQNRQALGIQHFEIVGLDARFEAAAHEGFHQPVEYGIEALFVLLDGLRLAAQAARDLIGNILIPEFPAKAVGYRPSYACRARTKFPFKGQDFDHIVPLRPIII